MGWDEKGVSSKAGIGFDRRAFLQGAGALFAAFSITPTAEAEAPGSSKSAGTDGEGLRKRREDARKYRVQMAKKAERRNEPLKRQHNNGEEQDFPNRIANYSKGLPHNGLGDVDGSAYNALLRAVRTGRPADFDAIPLAGTRKLTSPQAGLAFDLEGPDSHSMAIRPAPRIDGPENSSEMAELYWMALARDVPFVDYGHSSLIDFAASDLSAFSDFRGPKEGGRVTRETIFRGTAAGDLAGPYISQFLLKEIPYGSLRIVQRQQTLRPGIDYLTDYAEWLAVQNGAGRSGDAFDPTRRYIRSLRDFAQYVHVDALYEAYLNACLILLSLGTPIDPGLPPVSSPNQIGFAEFGGPHILSLVTEVATRALKAVWCQKWLVHRRLRPEEFGGRIHNHLTGAATYPIDQEILDSGALAAVYGTTGTYLLPQAYRDGCPTHPAYGAGHATVAGACVTIQKAFFDESFEIPDPVESNADGTDLLPYSGTALTVGGELNKVAANIAIGRNAAGIHWRTDYSESILLGEGVAIGILEEQKHGHNQDFSMTLTRFDGTRVTI